MPEIGASVKRFVSQPGLDQTEQARRTVECLRSLNAYFEALVRGLGLAEGLPSFLAQPSSSDPVRRDLRSVFFDPGGSPRFVTRWLGAAGDRPQKPPPLHALWALSDQQLLEEGSSFRTLLQEWLRSAQAFEDHWRVDRDRVVDRDSDLDYRLDPPLPEDELGPLAPQQSKPGDMREAIQEVKSLFEPLTEPFYDFLALPGLGGSEPGLPGWAQKSASLELLERETPAAASVVSTEPSFPPHLQILCYRLSRALERQDPIASANAAIESIDYMVRLFAGVLGGAMVELESRQEQAPVDLEFDECLEILRDSLQGLKIFRGDVIADSLLAVFEPGGSTPDHHRWLWLGEERQESPAVWRVRAENRVQEEDPGPCSKMLRDILPVLSEWLEASKYFFKSWDFYFTVRRDLNLDILMTRGSRTFRAFPLVYPERYGILLSQAELDRARQDPDWRPRGFSEGPSLNELVTPQPAAEDPPHLRRLLQEFGEATAQGEPLPAGAGLLGCFDFLLRYYASLTTGALKSIAPFPLESVLSDSSSLLHCSKLLHYSLHALERFPDHPVTLKVVQVFYDRDRPRAFTRWLGLAGSPVTGLENLAGWTHVLRRPDAALRVDEILGQIRVYNQFLREWLEASRQVFRDYEHHFDVGATSNTLALVLQDGKTRFRAVPDIYVGGYGFHLDRAEVSGRSFEDLSASQSTSMEQWEKALEEDLSEALLEDDDALRELIPDLEAFDTAELVMPSLFPDDEAVSWTQAEIDAFSRYCQALNYSGPESRPTTLCQRVGKFVAQQTRGWALLEAPAGFGKTFLSRTLTNPRSSPFETDFPVVHYQVNRRIEGDYSILVEVLNEHIGQQSELIDVGFKKLDPPVVKDLNVRYQAGHEPGRFLAYLNALRIANKDRRFLIILDGIDEFDYGTQAGLNVIDFLPSRLPEGVFLLLTYSPNYREVIQERLRVRLEEEPSLALRLEEEEASYRGLLYQHLEGLDWNAADINTLIKRAGGGLALAKLLRDGVLCGYYGSPAELPAGGEVFKGFLDSLHSLFPQAERLDRALSFLMLLSASTKPLSVDTLVRLKTDPKAVKKLTELFPSLFAFWGEDEPFVGLAHNGFSRHLSLQQPGPFRKACRLLVNDFLEQLDFEWMPRAFWWAVETDEPALMEKFVEDERLVKFRLEELGHLDRERRYHEKVIALDGWVALLRSLIQNHERPSWREELGWAHSSRALAYLHLGQFQRCLEDVDIAIEVFTRLFENEGQVQLTSGLAAAYNRRSEANLLLGELSEASIDSDRAIGYYLEAIESQQRHDLARLLALAYVNRGEVQKGQQSLESARDDITESIEIYLALEPLSERDTQQLARAFRARGVLSLSLGENTQAYHDSSQALELLTSLAETHQHQEFRNELASVYNNRAAALHRVEEYEASMEDYDQAVALRQQLVDEKRLDVRTDLAITHNNRGLVRTAIGDVEGALEDYEAAISIRSHLVHQEERSDLRTQLAFTRVCRGSIYRSLGRREEAVADYGQAAREYERAIDNAELSLEDCLTMAMALGSLATLYLDVQEPSLCLKCCQTAVELYLRVPEVETDPVYLYEMALLLNDQAEAQRNLGAFEQARKSLEESAEAFAHLVEEHGRGELAGELASVYVCQGRILANLGQPDVALAKIEQALHLYEQFEPGPQVQQRVAEAHLVLGHVQRLAQHFDKAEEDFQLAIDGFRGLVEEHDRYDLEGELGGAYRQRALTYKDLGDHQQAVNDLEAAAVHLARAWEISGGDQGRQLLAEVFLQKASHHRRLDQSREAVDSALEAHRFSPQGFDQAQLEEVSRLFRMLAREGDSLGQTGHLGRAIRKYSEAIRLCRALNGENSLEWAGPQALAHRERGWLYGRMHKSQMADTDLTRSVELYGLLTVVDSIHGLEEDFASAYLYRARHFAATGRRDRALGDFSSALELLRRLNRISARFERPLAFVLLERSRLAFSRRDFARALLDVHQALYHLDILSKSEHDDGFRFHHALAFRQKGEVLEALKRCEDAYGAYRKGVTILRVLTIQKDHDPSYPQALIQALLEAAQVGGPDDERACWIEIFEQIHRYHNQPELASHLPFGRLKQFLAGLDEGRFRVLRPLFEVMAGRSEPGPLHPVWQLFEQAIRSALADPQTDAVERGLWTLTTLLTSLTRQPPNETLWLRRGLELVCSHSPRPARVQTRLTQVRQAILALPEDTQALLGFDQELLSRL